MIIPCSSEDERLKVRRRYVGSSDAAALFNLSPYMTRYGLWQRKRGERPDEDPDLAGSERVRLGKYLQPGIGAAIADKYHLDLTPTEDFFVSDDIEGIGASTDFYAEHPEHGPGLIEAKLVDILIYRDQWTARRAPEHIEIQLQQQLLCSGMKWGAICPVVGGSEVKMLVRRPNRGMHKRIATEARSFWKEVRTNTPPEVVAADLPELSQTNYPLGDEERPVDWSDDKDLMAIADRWVAAKQANKLADAEEKDARAKLLLKMADHKAVRCGFYVVRQTKSLIAEAVITRRAHVRTQLRIKEDME